MKKLLFVLLLSGCAEINGILKNPPVIHVSKVVTKISDQFADPTPRPERIHPVNDKQRPSLPPAP